MNRVYIGYDPREDLAYEVCRSSIIKRTEIGGDNVWVAPIKLKDWTDLLKRPIEWKNGQMWCPISEAPVSTEFAVSRFLIPFFNNNGWALFIDCDTICLTDIRELFELADDKYAVMCVKHKQESGELTKNDGHIQTYYKRKNWSSVVLWNCSHPANKRLTLENLNTWPGRDLHAFEWLQDDEIGELPKEWNHLVGVQEQNQNAKILHYTLGGGWIKDWGLKYAEDYGWIEEYRNMRKNHKTVIK